MFQLKDENATLCEKLALLKTDHAWTQNQQICNSQDSSNDLEFTASFGLSGKTLMKTHVPGSKQVLQPKGKTIISKYTKRKKLLDDADTKTLFDDFEFDTSEHGVTLPKRYTKKKKTIGI